MQLKSLEILKVRKHTLEQRTQKDNGKILNKINRKINKFK